ncbi:MAG: hypothetical protein AB3N28_06400, partial [Kordiimonas sp.]
MLSKSILIALLSSPFLASETIAVSNEAQLDHDEDIDTIVVTGSKIGTRLLDLPASATILNETAIERARIENLADIERHVPNLTIGRLG